MKELFDLINKHGGHYSNDNGYYLVIVGELYVTFMCLGAQHVEDFEEEYIQPAVEALKRLSNVSGFGEFNPNKFYTIKTKMKAETL